MISMTTKLTAAVALAMLAAPLAAMAEDFNVEVPIAFSRLPLEINSLVVSCTVGTHADSSDRAYRLVGSGMGRGTISGGARTESVFVRFNAMPRMDPTSARYYSCALTLNAGATAYHSVTIADGTAFPLSGPATVHVRGPIPR